MEAGGAEEREQLAAGRRGAETGDEVVLRERALLEELLHEGFVGLGHHLDEPFARRGGRVGEVGGDVALRHLAGVVREGQRLHAHEVNDAVEPALFAERDLNRDDGAAAVAVQRLEGALEAGALTFEAIDDDEARQVERGRVRPELLRLYFDAGYRVHHQDRAFGHAQRGARIGQEVRESGSVDDVDLGLLPLGVGKAGGERVLAGDRFVVEIRDRGPFVNLPEAIDGPGCEQHGGDQLGLAASAMPDYSHVADAPGVVDLHRDIPPRLLDCHSRGS
jgi:hypothetical protein